MFVCKGCKRKKAGLDRGKVLEALTEKKGLAEDI